MYPIKHNIHIDFLWFYICSNITTPSVVIDSAWPCWSCAQQPRNLQGMVWEYIHTYWTHCMNFIHVAIYKIWCSYSYKYYSMYHLLKLKSLTFWFNHDLKKSFDWDYSHCSIIWPLCQASFGSHLTLIFRALGQRSRSRSRFSWFSFFGHNFFNFAARNF